MQEHRNGEGARTITFGAIACFAGDKYACAVIKQVIEPFRLSLVEGARFSVSNAYPRRFGNWERKDGFERCKGEVNLGSGNRELELFQVANTCSFRSDAPPCAASDGRPVLFLVSADHLRQIKRDRRNEARAESTSGRLFGKPVKSPLLPEFRYTLVLFAKGEEMYLGKRSFDTAQLILHAFFARERRDWTVAFAGSEEPTPVQETTEEVRDGGAASEEQTISV